MLLTLSLCAEITLAARYIKSIPDETNHSKEKVALETNIKGGMTNEVLTQTVSKCSNLTNLPLENNCFAAGYDGLVVVLSTNATDLDSKKSRLFVSSSSVTSPIYLTIPHRVDSVSCGASHSLALACGGSVVLSWGSNVYGQLGIGGDDVDVSARFVENPTPVVRGEDG